METKSFRQQIKSIGLKTLNSLKRNALCEKGSALQLALVTTVLLMFLATEIASESLTQYLITNKELKRVKTYYAAEGCMEINLLRVKIFQHVASLVKGQVPTEFLDKIWQFPMTYPPTVGEDVSKIKAGELKQLVKDSLMKEQWTANIQPEGNRIDINDLASPSEVIRDRTKQSLLQIFREKVENDEKFSDRWGGFNFEELINNIVDWVDRDKNSLNGGDENGYYRELPDNEFLPPNQAFKTLDELHMVAGMKDEIFKILKERVTIFGVKGININYADKKVLLGLNEQFDEEFVDELIKRRQDPEEGGPFKNLEEFKQFLDDRGIDSEEFENGSIPLVFDPEFNFRVECIGTDGKVSRKLVAIVYDFDRVKERLVEFLKKEKQDEGQGDENGEDTNTGGVPSECENAGDNQQIAQCICNRKDPRPADGEEMDKCVADEKKKLEDKKKADEDAKKKKEEAAKVKPGRPNVVRWYEEVAL